MLCCVCSHLGPDVEGCDLQGLDKAVLDVQGVVVQTDTFEDYSSLEEGDVIDPASLLVFDEDPNKFPIFKCGGQQLVVPPAAGRGGSPVRRRKLPRNKNNGTQAATPRRSATRRGKKLAPAARKAPSTPKRNTANGERTFWVGPGRIFTGVVYAHTRHGKLQSGFFQYVRPFFDETLYNTVGTFEPIFEQITEAEVGDRKVYTPFQYRIQLKSRKQYSSK
jgi:hypothetical protein